MARVMGKDRATSLGVVWVRVGIRVASHRLGATRFGCDGYRVRLRVWG